MITGPNLRAGAPARPGVPKAGGRAADLRNGAGAWVTAEMLCAQHCAELRNEQRAVMKLSRRRMPVSASAVRPPVLMSGPRSSGLRSAVRRDGLARHGRWESSREEVRARREGVGERGKEEEREQKGTRRAPGRRGTDQLRRRLTPRQTDAHTSIHHIYMGLSGVDTPTKWDGLALVKLAGLARQR